MFQEKTVEMLNSKTADVINSFAVSGKIRLIGSNSLRSSRYGSDYDIETILKGVSIPKIARMLQEEFKKASKNPDIYITDFKAGYDPRLVYKGDYTDNSLKKYLKNPLVRPATKKAILASSGEERIERVRDLFILRWTPQDIQRGFVKLIDGTQRTLEQALQDKTTTKIDLLTKVGDRFAEISENYYIKVGDKGNFSQIPTKKETEDSLEEDIHYYSKVDSFKSLKRLFSLLQLDGKKKNKEKLENLVKFFNGNVGYMNKIKNELGILETLLTGDFRHPKWEDIRDNLQMIKEQIAEIYSIPVKNSIFSEIDHTTPATALSLVRSIKDYFSQKINEISKDFLRHYI